MKWKRACSFCAVKQVACVKAPGTATCEECIKADSFCFHEQSKQGERNAVDEQDAPLFACGPRDDPVTLTLNQLKVRCVGFQRPEVAVGSNKSKVLQVKVQRRSKGRRKLGRAK